MIWRMSILGLFFLNFGVSFSQLLTQLPMLSFTRRFFSTKPTVGRQILSTIPTSNSTALQVAPSQITVLNNGVRVVSEERRGETASVGVFIKAGSRNETKANNGVAHFLEHMYFKVC